MIYGTFRQRWKKVSDRGILGPRRVFLDLNFRWKFHRNVWGSIIACKINYMLLWWLDLNFCKELHRIFLISITNSKIWRNLFVWQIYSIINDCHWNWNADNLIQFNTSMIDQFTLEFLSPKPTFPERKKICVLLQYGRIGKRFLLRIAEMYTRVNHCYITFEWSAIT